jgi:putative peptide zinc metalloprotease protein
VTTGGMSEAARGVRSSEEDTREPIRGDDARPALAPGLELVGRLQGAGFAEDQWLVRLDGRFIQLTELLFRVAEALDGRRTHEEIATAVTASTPWLVTREQITLLIETKLAPLGVVLVPGLEPPAAAARPLSALGMTVRLGVIQGSTVQRLAGPLGTLFGPPAVAAFLIAVAAGHLWLFLVHGVAGAVLQVLYAPVLFLVLLLVLLMAAVFHELGHAAGLIYGGGRVGSIGVGLFVIYPALYTDVTDSYRLSRAARLRTDLGGIYFHLVAALAILALYFVTGQEFLLLAIVLIDAEIVRQLIPFVRLDGYWTFADLTGIPDPFSLAVPFLGRFLPLPGPRLPPLRPWVERAFLLFLLLSVPALIVLLVLFLAGLPAFLSASWDSLIHQLGELGEAQKIGDPVAVVFTVVQVAFVSLTLLGVSYLLLSLLRSLARPLWRWSNGNERRRVMVGAGGVLAVAALGLVWLPQMPFFASAPNGTQTFSVSGRAHVEGPVQYAQSPPVGGDHAPIWQNCGFYSQPVAAENAVHSLEHGAVWITYRSDLPPSGRETLRRLARSQIHVLVSPYPNLSAPVVASAWGHQLRLDSPDDPRLAQFLKAFRLGPQAPERGGPCTGGVGQPE